MKKRWLIGGLCVAVTAGAGVAVMTGVLSLPGGSARAKADGASPAQGSRGEGGDKKPEVALEFVQQEVVQPKLARLPGVVEFSGPLVAPQTAMVRARASGTLLALNVAEGSRVVAGQTLGRIELADLASRVAERSAMLESARAALVQAERTHASNESLAAQKFISPNALESSSAALATARAQLNAAQASLDTTRAGLPRRL